MNPYVNANWHKLSEIDSATNRATCSKCGPETRVALKKNGYVCRRGIPEQVRLHKLTNINEENRTADCAYCGLVKIHVKNYKKTGASSWGCGQAGKEIRRSRLKIARSGYDYTQHKKDYCEKCSFMGKPCQLDVDHIDGNKFNNEQTNLQTLCANCHRLKTWLESQAKVPKHKYAP